MMSYLPPPQVKFEASLPPSHQTRFGDDSDEDEEGRRRRAGYYSLDQQVLLKGSACDRGFQRRQVGFARLGSRSVRIPGSRILL